MPKQRRPHDPLRGLEPATAAAMAEPEETTARSEPRARGPAEPDLAQGLMDPVARRAVDITARKFGVQPGTPTWGARHDKFALRVYNDLRNGRPVHEVDPTPMPAPRKPEVMPWEWSNPVHRLRQQG